MNMDDFSEHEHWMREALSLAREAALRGEVPVGAIVVHEGRIIGRGGNGPIALSDPTAHAEVLALREAAAHLGNYRLDGCSLYVTLEPCTMCSGAMLHARLARVVFGAQEPKTGAAGSVLDVFAEPRLNHQTQVVRGVLARECAQLMADFFARRRAARKTEAGRAAARLPDWAVRNSSNSDEAFEEVFPSLPGEPGLRWCSDLPALRGLRMAVFDARTKEAQGERHGGQTWLCVHGSPASGQIFAAAVPLLLAAGHRVVIPDLPGFGRSDQPKKAGAHQAGWHAQILRELAWKLPGEELVLLGQGDGAWLALRALADGPGLRGACLLNAWPRLADSPPVPEAHEKWHAEAARKSGWLASEAVARLTQRPMDGREARAWDAPFARPGHRAALQAWPAVQRQLLADELADESVHALLGELLAAGRLLLCAGEQGSWWSAQELRAAWLAALPQLEQYPGAWRLTPLSSLVPDGIEAMSRGAVEYFERPLNTLLRSHP